MLLVSVCSAAGGGSECGVLDDLEFVKICVGCNGRPYRAGIFDYWTGDGFVGGDDGFFLFAPVGRGENF